MHEWYIEFWLVDYNGSNPFLLQSKLFKTKDEALRWARESFDYIDMKVSLMRVDYLDRAKETYDIQFVAEIR